MNTKACSRQPQGLSSGGPRPQIPSLCCLLVACRANPGGYKVCTTQKLTRQKQNLFWYVALYLDRVEGIHHPCCSRRIAVSPAGGDCTSTRSDRTAERRRRYRESVPEPCVFERTGREEGGVRSAQQSHHYHTQLLFRPSAKYQSGTARQLRMSKTTTAENIRPSTAKTEAHTGARLDPLSAGALCMPLFDVYQHVIYESLLLGNPPDHGNAKCTIRIVPTTFVSVRSKLSAVFAVRRKPSARVCVCRRLETSQNLYTLCVCWWHLPLAPPTLP